MEAERQPELQRLEYRLVELQASLERNHRHATYGDDSILEDRRRRVTLYICGDVRDVLTLGSMFLAAAQEHFAIGDQVNSIQRSGEIKDQAAFRGLFLRYTDLTSQLTVLIKAMAQTLANIENLFEDRTVSKALSRRTREELERLIIYRDKLVVHKKLLGVLAGVRFGGQDQKVEIMSALTAPEELYKRVAALFDKCRGDLPEEFRSEGNAHEQLGILYSNYNRISDHKLRREIKDVIGNFGVISPQPSEMVECATVVLEELVSFLEEHA